MKIGVRRQRILSEGSSLALGAGFAGFVLLALPIIFFLVNFVDPEESTVYLTLAAAIGLPAALVYAGYGWRAAKLDPRAPCGVCKAPLQNCICCEACEGTGETPAILKLDNWLMPSSCIRCLGTGDERPDKRGPPRMKFAETQEFCCGCGRRQFGKHVGVVKLSVITQGNPQAYNTVVATESREVGAETVFLCVDCGKGSKDQAAAENTAANLLTQKMHAPHAFSGTGYSYSGATSWRAAVERHGKK